MSGNVRGLIGLVLYWGFSKDIMLSFVEKFQRKKKGKYVMVMSCVLGEN